MTRFIPSPQVQTLKQQPSRRDFLSGSALVGPIRDRASAVAAREYVHFSRRAMACEFSVFFPADKAGDAARRSAAALAALDLVDALEAQLSIYRDDSEISLLNQLAAQQDVVVEGELYGLLKRAHHLWQETHAAFDITAGPLSRLWGFSQRQPRLPDSSEIAATLAAIGSDKLVFDDQRQSVRFADERLDINLGAIGKGYALDRCARELRAAGENTFLLHGGRSSVLAVTDRGSAPWQIDLRYPSGEQSRIASLYLTHHAMATSGDAVQRVTLGDRTYGHIIDPRTGWPAHGVVTATAFAPTAADADALATAFYLMGAQESVAYCERHADVGAILVVGVDSDGQFDVQVAGKIPARVEWDPASGVRP